MGRFVGEERENRRDCGRWFGLLLAGTNSGRLIDDALQPRLELQASANTRTALCSSSLPCPSGGWLVGLLCTDHKRRCCPPRPAPSQSRTRASSGRQPRARAYLIRPTHYFLRHRVALTRQTPLLFQPLHPTSDHHEGIKRPRISATF